MRPDLAIAGVAQSRYYLHGTSARLEEMIFDTTAAALADAGLTRDEVDSIVIAASDAVDGRCISSMLCAHAAGAYLKDEIKAAGDGAFALIVAALRILTGEFHTSLVVAWSKPSESRKHGSAPYNAEPFFHRPFGLNHVTATALMASAYQKRVMGTGQSTADIVAHHTSNGCSNPLLDGAAPLTVAQVRDSRPVAWPLRELEMAPPADGACALVLTRVERARDLRHRPVYVRGMGWCADSYYLGQRDLCRFAALENASSRAFAMAGAGLDSVDVAEIYDGTAWHALLALDALGLAGNTRCAINPSGGCLSAYPLVAAGLVRVVEAYLQVAGRAGERQVSNARIALAHGATGLAAQSHAVVLLSAN